MLDVCEFVRVGDDANGPNSLSVCFDGEYSICSVTGARDERGLTIDLRQLHMSALW